MKLYVSRERDPFFHLAVEEWLLRESGEEAFFLYQNRPCVVLGRFQNPWLECDLGWMRSQDITLVRRMSGGGTVWHDEGNVNFCWVGPLKGFHKDNALRLMVDKLQSLGVHVAINARHDLVVPEADGSTRKVSGSAFKQTKDRALHHGTLLLRSDLTQLGRVLRSPHTLTETRSIPSVRSVVMNLNLDPQAWISSWGTGTLVSSQDARFRPSVWQDWQWVMGETPLFKWHFKLAGEEVSLSAHKGLIKELDWVNRGLKFEELNRRLESATFAELAGGQIVESQWKDFLGV